MDDYFLRLDGIPGESQDAKHKDEIQVASFSWGVTQLGGDGRGGGGGAGRSQFQDFRFVTRVNKASPQLFLACAGGRHIKEAHFTVRRGGKTQLEYLKITFRDVLVTSFEESAGADAPEETVGLQFGQIEIEYTPQQATGAAAAACKAGWDLARNAPI